MSGTRSTEEIENIVSKSEWATAVPNDRNDNSWAQLRIDCGLSDPELSKLKNNRFPSTHKSVDNPAATPTSVQAILASEAAGRKRSFAATQHDYLPLSLDRVVERVHEVLRVDDPTMGYVTPSAVCNALLEHLTRDQQCFSKGCPALLLYGHPGCGKTRLLRELASATTDASHTLTETLRLSGSVDLTEWLPIACTFNNSTTADDMDARLARKSPILPLWARIVHTYYDTEYSLSAFIVLKVDLVEEVLPRPALDTPSLLTLLSTILRHSGKRKLLLLIDENLRLGDEMEDSQFTAFLQEVNRLQDYNAETPDKPVIKVVWTGLLDGPWRRAATASGRILTRHLLPPLPIGEDRAVLLIHNPSEAPCDRERGLRLLASLYRSGDPGATRETLLARHLLAACAGLPRAVQVVRMQLGLVTSGSEILDFIKVCALGLRELYKEEPSDETLHLAVLGLPISSTTRTSSVTSDKLAYKNTTSANIHSAMSRGECMLVDNEETNNDEDQPLLPPLRLLKAKFLETQYHHLHSLLMCSLSVSPLSFEAALLHHEIHMRNVRRWLVDHEDASRAVHASDYSRITLQELYCGAGTHRGDIKATWRSSVVERLTFDVTLPLTYVVLKRFPAYSDRKHHVNTLIRPDNVNNKGYEWGMILEASDGEMVAVMIQTKFTDRNAIQEAKEILEAVTKTEAALSTDEGPKHEAALGWPNDRVVTIFLTNRLKRNYQENSNINRHNVIVLCRNSLREYLGPTVWAMFATSETLSELWREGQL